MTREIRDTALRNAQDARVLAPAAVVWRQLALTPALFVALPVAELTIAPDARSATFVVRLGAGPIGFRRGGSLHVTEHREPARFAWDGRIDGLCEITAAIELSATDAEETRLSYTVDAVMAQRMRRVTRVLSAVIDEHVAALVRQITGASERQFKARVAMAGEEPKP